MRTSVIGVCALLLASATLAGCTDKLTLSSASIDAPDFTVTPEKGDASTVFKVDAGSLSDLDVVWDFGDGKTAKGGSAEHKYGFTNGIMTITMLVTDASGKQGIATKTVTLGNGRNAKPSLSLSANPSWVEVRRAVNLTAGRTDTYMDPLPFLWTYRVVSGGAADDGHGHDHGATGTAATKPGAEEFVLPGSERFNSVTFDAPGKYAVKVRVRDPKGAEETRETTIDVSKKIPDPVFEVEFSGTLVAGTGGQASVSEQLWATPAPDTFADAARHPYSLLYPASTIVILTWNDTSGQRVWDLDLELKNAATNETVFHSQTRAPAAPFEFNFTQQEPGDYVVIVRNIAGAQVVYDLTVRASLLITPERVAAVEGS